MNAYRFSKLVSASVSLAGAVIVTTGCHRGGAQTAPPAPPQVTVARVQQQDIIEWEEFTGHTEAVEFVEVRPRVSGHIQDVRFQSGALVKKGDVLFVIDPRWHQAEFDRRQAEFDQARARLENLEHEAARTALLLEKKAISTEDAEARQSRYTEAKAACAAAAAARDSAKLDLEYTEIRSPIDGRVSRALVTAGNYVSGVAAAATLLTTVVSVDPIYIYADVDENSLLKFSALSRAGKIESDGNGQTPVEFQLADEDGFPHKGRIESFDNQLDPKTGSIVLRAIFPNPDGRILPGLFARLRIPASEKHRATLVDDRTIGTDQAQKYVLTLSPTNTVEYRPVKLGPSVNGKRIVRSGLQPGETIVVNGLQRVRPGMPVTPQMDVASQAGDGGLKTARR